MSKLATPLAALAMTTALSCGSLLAQDIAKTAKGRGVTPKVFRVWVFADAHVGSDKKYGRESLADANSTIRNFNRLSHDLNFLPQLYSLPAESLCGKIQFEALGVEGGRA
jgi:hypothetical protein